MAIVFNPDTWTLPGSGSCVTLNGGNAVNHGFSLGTSNLNVPGSANCPSSTNHTLPTPTWSTFSKVCETTLTGGCGQGEVCAPAFPSEFDQCIWIDGDATCPTGPYTERRLRHENFTDTRDCSQCGCAQPTGTCDGNAFVTNGGCGGLPILIANVPQGGMCKPHSNPGGTHAYLSVTPNASCTETGGTLSGDVQTSGTKTFCCLP